MLMFAGPGGNSRMVASSADAAAGGGDVEMQRIPIKSSHDKPGASYEEDSFTDHDHDDFGPLLMPQDSTPESDGMHPRTKQPLQPQVYAQRWVQLGYLSTLALLSDWICFSTASIPDVFEEAY